jgi:hypothetical protein
MNVITDILIWNINSMMAKMYQNSRQCETLNVSDTIFLHILKDNYGNVKQASMVNMISPIKCEFMYNRYVSSGNKKSKEMGKIDRFACESDISSEDIIKEINGILNCDMNKHKNVWGFENYSDIVETDNYSIKDNYEIETMEEVMTSLNYVKNSEIKYSLDCDDSFYCLVLCLSFMFLNRHFV